MSALKVKLSKKLNLSYDVLVERGCRDVLVADVINDCAQFDGKRKYAIIADSKVAKLYADQLVKDLKKKKVTAEVFKFTAGEKSKNWDTVQKIARNMIKAGYTRSDCVIALGGGVTGDIAGFVAAVFMRGVDFIQVPTSLLAMTDAAIGGKTGVNIPEGKNLLGAFYQPLKVYVDVNFLETLAKKEIQNGYAEIVKHAVIDDKRLFKMMEKATTDDLLANFDLINQILVRSCAVKTRIVTKDEKEAKLRMKLNLGHTLAHAIEKEAEYKIDHGKAVAIGLSKICEVAVAKNMLKEKQALRIYSLLKKIGLPIVVPKKYEAKKLIEAMAGDKKVKKSKLYFIVPRKIGKVVITDEVKAKDFMKVI